MSDENTIYQRQVVIGSLFNETMRVQTVRTGSGGATAKAKEAL